MAMDIVLQIFILLLSVVLHECAHGLVALWRGDLTAKMEGRLTLNPVPHLDAFGSVILPLLQWLTSGQVFFAYAKPVPVNPFGLKNPHRDMLWVGLAGPVTNLALGLISGYLLRLGQAGMLALPQVLIHPLAICCVINLWLAAVNLIPVPPLDGSRIIQSLLPRRTMPAWIRFEQLGFFVILLLLMTGFFDRVIAPLIRALLIWITGIS